MKRTLQNCSKFSKRSLKEQNLAILEAANFAKRFIQTSLNKKAHTPTILLFIAALILVILALFTFVSFNDKFAEDSEGRSQILGNIIFYEQYIIKKAEVIGRETIISGGLIMTDEGLKERFKTIAEKENLGITEFNSFFEKIKNNEFEFKWNGKEFFFEMKNLSLGSSIGANSMKRTLSFNISFDFNGNAKIYK